MLFLGVTFAILAVIVPSFYPSKPYLAFHLALPLLSLAAFFFFLFCVRPSRKYNKELREDILAGKDLMRNRVAATPVGVALLSLIPGSEAACCANSIYKDVCIFNTDSTSFCLESYNVTNPHNRYAMLTQSNEYVCDLSPDCGVYSRYQVVAFIALLLALVLWAMFKISNMFSVLQSTVSTTEGSVVTTKYNYFSCKRVVASVTTVLLLVIVVFTVASFPVSHAKIFNSGQMVSTPEGEVSVDEFSFDATCTFDEFFYATNGVIIADCLLGARNNDTLTVTLTRSEEFSKIPRECLLPNNIIQAQSGYPVCKVVNNKVVYDRKLLVNPKRKIPNPAGDTYVFRDLQRSIGNRGMATTQYSIILDPGFKVAFTADNNYKQDCATRFVSGVIPTVEGQRQSDCPLPIGTTYAAWDDYVCTHDRREVYSCKKGYLAAAKSADTEITCYPVSEEDFLAYVSPTLNPYTPNGNIKLTGEVGGIKPGFKFTTTFLSYDLDVTVTYFETSQDNDQAAGQDKYFVYSFLTTVRTSSKDFHRRYAEWIKSTDDYPGGTYNAVPYSKVAFSKTSTYIAYNTKNIVRIDVPPPFSDRTFCAMRQDYVGISTVYKSDVFNKLGEKYDPDSESEFPVADDDGMYTYSIPVYIATRLYGPSSATILLFGRAIERVTLTNGLTDCVNCVKFQNVWYEPDFKRMSVDITVTGYPLTKLTSLSTYGPVENTQARNGELFQFYLTHPKMGAAMYLAKVSTTASLGKFSVNGPCKQSHQTEDGTLLCDGLPAFEVPIVKYTTFYAPRQVSLSCSLTNNTHTCLSTLPTKGYQCATSHDTAYTDCKTLVSTNHTHVLSEHQTVRVVVSDEAYEVSRGTAVCKFCDFHMISELYHRCTYCVYIFYSIVSFGLILLTVLLLAIPVSMFNLNNFCTILYRLGLRTECDGFPIRSCNYCDLVITSAIEFNKHKRSCSRFTCPICTRNKVTGRNMELYSRQFPNHILFRKHMAIHRTSRISPVLGYIKINTSAVIAFTYISLVTLQGSVNATGLRNENVGRDIPIPSDQLVCGDETCTLSGNTILSLPFTRGAKFTLSGNKQGVDYRKQFEITESKMTAVCTYLYTATGFKTSVSHTKVKCLHTMDCNKFGQSDLFLPLAGGDSKYIPFDLTNPLKNMYCPTSFACRSPAVGFLDLYDGCLTVDDGVVVGYNTILPKVFEPVLPVFECALQNYQTTVCSTDDCVSKISNQVSIQNQHIKFPTVALPLDPVFRVGVLIEQGKTAPLAIYYGAPDVTDYSVPAYSYRMLDVPQAELCTQGTTGPDIDCRISRGAFHYVTECRNKNMELNVTKLDSDLPALSTHIPCSAFSSSVSWTTTVQSRDVIIGGKQFSDTQTVARPSLNLQLDHCNMGYRDVIFDGDSGLRLDVVSFNGKIDKLQCSGAYNRNLRAQFDITTDTRGGLLHLKCGSGVSENCLIDTSVDSSCNVTVLGPFMYNCTYTSDGVVHTIETNCTGLALIDPDFASYHIIGPTGSGFYDTWFEAGSLVFTNNFGRYLVITGCVIVVLFLFWIISCLVRMCRVYTSLRETSKPYYNAGMFTREKTR